MKVTQSCPTLCDPMYYTIHGILQARILVWVAVPFSRGSSHPKDQIKVSHVAGRFFASCRQGSIFSKAINLIFMETKVLFLFCISPVYRIVN